MNQISCQQSLFSDFHPISSFETRLSRIYNFPAYVIVNIL